MSSLLFAFIVCILFVFAVIKIRHSQLKLAKEFFVNEIQLQKIIRSHNKDKMEIDPLNVELHELLGEGAFGIVRRGILWPRNCEIAVKMLKGLNGKINYNQLQVKCEYISLSK